MDKIGVLFIIVESLENSKIRKFEISIKLLISYF